MLMKLHRLLLSPRIAAILLSLIGLISVFGTIPADAVAGWFEPRGLFRKWWFISLLIGLAAATGYSAVVKTIRLIKRPTSGRLSLSPSRVIQGPVYSFPISFHKIQAFEKEVSRLLGSKKYRVDAEGKDSEMVLTGRKNSWGEWGPTLVHFGLVITLAGGLVTFLYAHVREIMITEGETVQLPGTSSKMKLEKFTVIRHAGTREPEEYVSRLLVQNEEGAIRRRELKVNYPVVVSGYKLFQMRYRADVLWLELAVYQDGEVMEVFRIKPGEKKKLARLPFIIQAGEAVLPDFAVDQEGNVTSRSPYFLNPALSLTVYDSLNQENPGETFWTFEDLFTHQGEEKGLGFAIQRMKKQYASGIRLSKDPGAPVAYAGFFLLIAGSFLSGFVVSRKVIVRFTPSVDRKEIVMTVTGARSRDGFGLEREMESISRMVRNLFMRGIQT